MSNLWFSIAYDRAVGCARYLRKGLGWYIAHPCAIDINRHIDDGSIERKGGYAILNLC
jgi:hypothetical protein